MLFFNLRLLLNLSITQTENGACTHWHLFKLYYPNALTLIASVTVKRPTGPSLSAAGGSCDCWPAGGWTAGLLDCWRQLLDCWWQLGLRRRRLDCCLHTLLPPTLPRVAWVTPRSHAPLCGWMQHGWGGSGAQVGRALPEGPSISARIAAEGLTVPFKRVAAEHITKSLRRSRGSTQGRASTKGINAKHSNSNQILHWPFLGCCQ